MCEKHFNEPVLVDTEVVRLIGYAEDKHDAYLIMKKADGSVYWHSAVGGYIFLDCLKSQGYVISTEGEPWDDFYRLDCQLEFSSCPKEKEFLIDLRPEQGWEWETDDSE